MLSAPGRAAARAGVGLGRRNVLCALAIVLATAACTEGPTGSLVSARGATVAFESIDGPPQPVFQKLVENLATEAVAHQVTVISREAAPSYRIRSYMAAQLEGRRIHIGWVWDVYDANKRRVLRIANEEPARRPAGDAWNAADDAMLRRIARTGMDQLAVFLNVPGAAPPAAEPPIGQDGPAVAAADENVQPASSAAEKPAAPTRSAPRRPQRAAEGPGLAAALALADTRPSGAAR